MRDQEYKPRQKPVLTKEQNQHRPEMVQKSNQKRRKIDDGSRQQPHQRLSLIHI